MEIEDRLEKLDEKIQKLLDDKKTIEEKMFDCGAILKKLQLGNYWPIIIIVVVVVVVII